MLPNVEEVPAPSLMAIDRENWARQLNLSNFINAYYQFRDLQFLGEVKKVLIVGPGQGLDTLVMRWKQYDVTTFDIDKTFNPDVNGSVHDLSMFGKGSYDAIIVSHVLEHLAVPYLSSCLSELARVGRYCLIYLPVAGRHCQMRFRMDLRGLDISLILDFFNRLHRPNGITPRYCVGQHYWEMGLRGFRVSQMKRRLSEHFRILLSYRNKEWLPSYNFVLASKCNAK